MRGGAKVIHIGMGKRPGPITIFRLAKLFRSLRTQIVHAYLYDASLASRIAGRLAGVPVVLTSTRASLVYLPRLAWWIDRITSRWCERIIAVSEGTAAFIVNREGIPADKIKVVPNGVDLQRFRPGDRASARAALDLPADAFIIACIGRLHEQKGHRYLLDALASLRREYPFLLCLIAGEGPLRQHLESYAAHLKLGDACRFLGLVDSIDRLYNAVDAVVLPSLYEGMPNVVLEAMAMGRPVVATTVEGSVDLVRTGETGLLIPPADASALRVALQQLIERPDLCARFGAAALASAVRSHDIDRMIKALEQLYLTEWAAATDGGLP
jgi:glycosyltransferase involved in cell wall biosynthesis